MDAEVLRWTGTTEGDADDVTEGVWETNQDPITGEILNTWEKVKLSDIPATVHDETDETFTIRCVARGIVDGGIRVAGTTERFGDVYENIDYVKLWVPPRVRLSKRDRVTNIRLRKGGRVLWRNEEMAGSPPTVFNVNGVTPLLDAFNRHVESYVMLERADG